MATQLLLVFLPFLLESNRNYAWENKNSASSARHEEVLNQATITFPISHRIMLKIQQRSLNRFNNRALHNAELEEETKLLVAHVCTFYVSGRGVCV